jgi:hypothetical protein
MSLFQTNAWQKAWWLEWASTPGSKLLWEGGNGCSGLFIHRYTHRMPLKTKCLQYIGTSYRQFSAPRTEYNTLGPCEDLAGALVKLKQAEWTEAVFSDMNAKSEEFGVIQSWALENAWYLRNIREDTAYGICTVGSFSEYLNSLGRNTRLKLFNRRKIFEAEGQMAEENFWPNRAHEFFDLLNSFHVVRWGSPCFSSRSISFHLDFLNRASAEDIQPLLMVLSNGQRPVSVLYNALYRGCIYNIQAGFDEAFHKKVTLGSLHLGYAIEAAFANQAVHYFDLLAGEGKNTNYKSHLATDRTPLETFMIVRSRFFVLIYRTKDLFVRLKGA